MYKDTTILNMVSEYTQVLAQIGFEQVGEFPIEGKDAPEEKFYVFAHRDGFILNFDTYNFGEGIEVNSATLGCCAQNDSKTIIQKTAGAIAPIYEGETYTGKAAVTQMDARESLVEKINFLKENAKLITPLALKEREILKNFRCEQEFSALIDRGFNDFQARSEEFDRIGRERANVMPDWVKTMVNYHNN